MNSTKPTILEAVNSDRGDAKNYFSYRGKKYRPNSEIVFEERRLKILGKIGEGAFGSAFVVMDWETREFFILKAFKNLGPDERKNISRAMQIMSIADLPDGCVQKYVSVELDSEDLALYTYVPGEDLRKFQEKNRFKKPLDLEFDQALAITRELVQNWGLLAAKNLVHRDVSLNNATVGGTFIDPDYLAHVEQVEGESPLGHPWFLAPEACKNRPHITSDLYSIAVIGTTLILGGVPSRELGKNRIPGMRGWSYGATDSVDRLTARRATIGLDQTSYWGQVKGAPTWEGLRGKEPEVRGFVNMLGAMLAFNPNDRPQNAKECLELLSQS